EEQLLIADVGVETTRKIIANLTEGASRKQLKDAEALYGLLKDASAYLDLLQRMAADLSYPTSGLENAIHSAQSTASWAFYQW
ncbi:signal recognition particle receptor subunit alpha, partial [Salmonella enterica subsp. enterica serovar Kentucky]|nr:signal recognition particle receptor subunit alpha [Salmonella enterica subsp. enterica serovar Kentucky]